MPLRALLIFTLLGLLPRVAAQGMVVAQERRAAEAGAQVLRDGGTATDAAVATAFALAVTHPAAGNLGGGGFLLHRDAKGKASFLDFREMAPARAHARMFLREGVYDEDRHHESLRSVGVPGSVAGLHAAWRRQGKLPWARLLAPAIALARDGFPLSPTLAKSLEEHLPDFARHAPTLAQFSHGGKPLQAGDLLRQPDLADTLARIAAEGPAGFYRGRTAQLLAEEMARGGGLVTAKDLAAYTPKWRRPLRGTYRGHEVLAAPPPSSGGVVILEILNQLEGDDLGALGGDSPAFVHLTAEAMRRAYADRARWLGDPDFNPGLPVARLTSKAYAARLRKGIALDRASVSSPERFTWPHESNETTHLSVVDRAGNAVSLTTTLEDSYGLKRIVPGAGFLLNNEMGDFNAGPGLTDATGRIGTKANLAAPRKRMLSSMCPVILSRDGKLRLVAGSPGGRTIPNTTLRVVLNVVDFGMGAQAAVDAPRFHHQWLPDRIRLEEGRWPQTALDALAAKGHTLATVSRQGVAQVILLKDGKPEGGADAARWAESWAAAE